MILKTFFIAIGISFTISFRATSQVVLQTGAAEVNIPLYSFSDPVNRLGTGISLIYTAGNGLKVSEVPSEVGAGWELEYGGFIERVQNGEPDDQKEYGSFTYPTGVFDQANWTAYQNDYRSHYYPDGYMYSTYSSSTPVDNGGGYTPLYNSLNQIYKPAQKYLADREQDVFLFAFNGRSGRFVISKEVVNGKHKIRTLEDSKLLISYTESDMRSDGIRTRISEFSITDENGIIYKFNQKQYDQLCIYDSTSLYYPDQTRIGEMTNPRLVNNKIVNKWYLTEIDNPLTNSKIQFQYDSYDYSLLGDKVYNQSNANNHLSATLLIERKVGREYRIKKIILSTKETVDFNYSTSNRKDLPFDKTLEDIAVSYNNAVVYSWNFSYGYFVKNSIKAPTESFSAEDIVWSRLCLQALQRKSSQSSQEPPYIFSYYLGNENGLNSAVPPLFSYLQDHFGYYNPMYYGFFNPSNNTVSPSNPPYEPYGTNFGPLSYYSTPVSSAYNAGTYKAPSIEARNGIIKSVKNPFGGETQFEYTQNFVSNVPVTSQRAGGVRVFRTTLYDGNDHSKDIVTEYNIDNNGVSSGWGNEDFSNSYIHTSQIKAYACSGSKIPGVNLLELISTYRNALIKAQEKALLKAIDIKAQSVNKVIYDQQQARFAATQAAVGAVFMDFIISNIITPLINDILHTSNTYTTTLTQSKTLWGNNLLPFQYSRVEEVKKLGALTIGKTVYEFTSPADQSQNSAYTLDVPTLSLPYSAKPRCAYWLYGLPKRVSVYDQNNKLIKVTENTYNPIKYSLNDGYNGSQKWTPNKSTFDCSFLPSNNTSATDEISYDIYNQLCGRIELTQSKEYTYNNNNDYTTVTTNYEYSPNNYLLNKVKTTNSKGELIESNTYYPQDYTLTGAIQTIKNNNILDVPISSQTLITKTGNQKYVIGGSVSEFGAISNGDIKPINNYVFRNDNPVLSTSAPFNSSQLIPNSTYYQQNGSLTYDANGQPIQMNSDKGIVSTIYDNELKLPIATVINAVADDIAYTSFESITSGALSQQTPSGNWLLGQGSTINSIRSFTGRKSFSGRIDKTLIHPGNYTLTLWNLWNVTVNGQAGTVLATSGNWQLLKWDLTNVSSITILADNIDEVRLYPTGARMATTNYDPLVGKTSECDANNRVIFYQYDDLGRLKAVRDEKLNVIKTYEYNFKQ